MIEYALAKLLKDRAGVSDRVSPSTETVKLRPASGETLTEYPRIVFTRIASTTRYTDSGKAGIKQGRYQIDIFAARMTDAAAVAAQIGRDANEQESPGLDGYRGTVDVTITGNDGRAPVVTHDITQIERIYFDSDHFQRGERLEGAESTIARYGMDLIVEYRD